MIFYVGTDHPSWLWKEPIKYPLFISNRALSRYKSFKPADKAWSLDSGGFTELNMYGTWVTTPEQYIQQIRRYISEIGHLNWAAPQDWMCEPQVLKKTGFTVPEHQLLTVQNFQLLRHLAPDLPSAPQRNDAELSRRLEDEQCPLPSARLRHPALSLTEPGLS